VYAVQLAKWAGVRVVGTASSEESERLLTDLGIDEVVNYKRRRGSGEEEEGEISGSECGVFCCEAEWGAAWEDWGVGGTGKVRPVVQKVVGLRQAMEVYWDAQEGRVKGKIVLKIRDDE
jgi:NADPH:quinone reductase-like Zn-dependent oxidoreductase